ncbi:MAG: hypothetical protein JW772_04870 [Candidatus Diapherotrites archaeon]|nr:hypothetical protein [Candidatus Diapherotrites archaeon]
MGDKEEFVEAVRGMISAGQSKKEILDYMKSLGVPDKDSKAYVSEAEKALSGSSAKASGEMKTAVMENQIQMLKKDKNQIAKEKFTRNVAALNDMITKVKQELKQKESN